MALHTLEPQVGHVNHALCLELVVICKHISSMAQILGMKWCREYAVSNVCVTKLLERHVLLLPQVKACNHMTAGTAQAATLPRCQAKLMLNGIQKLAQRGVTSTLIARHI